MWDGSGWIPPRSVDTNGPHLDAENEANKELTGYDITDVHRYFELGRRIRNTATFAGIVAALTAVVLIVWRVTNGH